MEYTVLSGTSKGKVVNKKISRLIMGSGHFYRFPTKEENFKILDHFVERGGNMFDTAHQYRGSEPVLGEWIKTRNNRDQIYILSKGAHPDDGEPGKRVNPTSITKDLNESLERLQTYYIDFYALHRDDPNKEVGPIIEILNEHIVAGKIHAIGASNWTHERIQEANDYAEKHNLIGFTFNSPSLSLAKCNVVPWGDSVVADEETVEWHEKTQMPLLSWSSQAMGFFSGRFTPDNKENEDIVRVYYNDDNWERFARAKEIGERIGKSPIQVALAYVLNQNFPTAAVVGPMVISELDSSLEGVDIQLTKKEIDYLNLK